MICMSTKVGEGETEGVVGAVAMVGPGEHAEDAGGHQDAVEGDAAEASAGEDLFAWRGGRSISPGVSGSTPMAMAGGPSMMMLIHRSWMGPGAQLEGLTSCPPTPSERRARRSGQRQRGEQVPYGDARRPAVASR